MWEYCGMERTKEGLTKAIGLTRELKADFWKNVKVLGTSDSLNKSPERAGRVADSFELGELLCTDALNRRASSGGHCRAVSVTPDSHAARIDEEFLSCPAWEWGAEDSDVPGRTKVN